MSAILTKNFGVLSAKNFEKNITANANTYVAIGRQTSWANGDTIPTPVDTANTFYDLWDNIIGLKKINASDVNVVVPRIDWAANTIYVEYNQDVQMFAKANSQNVQYDNKFYVRNTYDQVFKCLFNNNSANSTVMPTITLGGLLPENPWISTNDGYKWKYLYTIPAGLKEKFFTSQYMPVISESAVISSAVSGRLDIVKILTAGAGYNANNNSNSYNIVTVVGNGTDANITLVVTAVAANGGNITGYNIIDAGQDYTRAALTLNDPVKIGNTASAELIAVIGPPGGHGSNPEQELGASNIMISVDIDGTENDILPINETKSEFRQVALIKDPKLTNLEYATSSVYRGTTKFTLTQPNKNFTEGETVYVGSTLASASFSAVVETYNNSSYEIYVNNLNGSISPPATLIGANSGAIATVLSASDPDVKKFSGDLLYIENTSRITRTATEVQQVKLTLRF